MEKVNKFYLQREAEVWNNLSEYNQSLTLYIQLKLRLQLLLERKRAIQAQSSTASRLSSNFYTLDEGFRQYSSDLNKLQVSYLASISSFYAKIP